MKAPTRKQLARMQWARKAVHPDGTTRGEFRWPVGVGGWVAQDGPADGKPCGVGLHLGKTARGLSSVHRLTESVLLIAGYLPDDVFGEDDDKVRVSRCWIVPGVTAGMPQVLRNGWGVGADLTGAYLAGADLIGADLTGANPIGARLAGADLIGARLAGADLIGADLTGANLSRADLTDADLTGADLTGAYLSRADLTGAYLTGAREVWGPCRRPSWLPQRWTVNDSGLIEEVRP